jgi:hypothetical protein
MRRLTCAAANGRVASGALRVAPAAERRRWAARTTDTKHELNEERLKRVLWRTGRKTGLTPVLPVTWSTLQVGQRDDDDLAWADTVDDLVRKTATNSRRVF